MRVKQIWLYFPVPAKLKLIWDRLTFTRLTTLYFVFSIVHCFIQVVLQAQAFSINAQAANLLYDIVQQGNATIKGFPVLGKDLRVCEHAPSSWSTEQCQVIWGGSPFNASASTADSSQSDSSSASSSVISSSSSLVSSSSATSAVSSTSASASSSHSAQSSSTASAASVSRQVVTATVTVLPTFLSNQVADAVVASTTKTVTVLVAPTAAPTAARREVAKRHGGKDNTVITTVDIDGEVQVTVDGLGDHEDVTLSRKCVVALNWPVMVLSDTKREDITFVAFQIWVLGMSIVALLNESIPHTIASLLTHLLATMWAGFQISNTSNFRANFTRLTTEGACGQNLLATYWMYRAQAEIPILVLNIVALCVSAFLSWRLVKLFGWQTFKRIGASLTVNRVYKLVLSLSIVIQLAVFFVVASLGLWIDQLTNGMIGMLATKGTLEKVIIGVTCIFLLPWLMLGWVSVRRELRVPMLIFLGLSLLYLTAWGAMFDSTTFRWTFFTWRFFSLVISASALLILATFILGVYCRINFGKGLPRYLNAQEPLPGDDFVPVADGKGSSWDTEKGAVVEFPSTDMPIPTFSAAFGRGIEVPPPHQMGISTAGAGAPRRVQFSMAESEESLELPAPAQPAAPAAAHARSMSLRDDAAPRPLLRQNSAGSASSFGAMFDHMDGNSEDRRSLGLAGNTMGGGKRWVIE